MRPKPKTHSPPKKRKTDDKGPLGVSVAAWKRYGEAPVAGRRQRGVQGVQTKEGFQKRQWRGTEGVRRLSEVGCCGDACGQRPLHAACGGARRGVPRKDGVAGVLWGASTLKDECTFRAFSAQLQHSSVVLRQEEWLGRSVWCAKIQHTQLQRGAKEGRGPFCFPLIYFQSFGVTLCPPSPHPRHTTHLHPFVFPPPPPPTPHSLPSLFCFT